MIVYCDTSVLVSAISAEQFSVLARDWLDQRPRASLSFSGWTDAEIASALARKQRSRQIDAVARSRGVALWGDLSRAMTRADVTPDDFAVAARLVDSGARGLWASDALHLAVVLRLDLGLATFDRDLAAAAQAEGVAVAFGPPIDRDIETGTSMESGTVAGIIRDETGLPWTVRASSPTCGAVAYLRMREPVSVMARTDGNAPGLTGAAAPGLATRSGI